jgi:hypothetical protein
MKHEVLNIICDTYQISISEYMQEALVVSHVSTSFCQSCLEVHPTINECQSEAKYS